MNIQQYENYHENKPHARGEFPYNTYLCSIPLDFVSVPLHWHDEVELIYIKKGSGIVSVDFTDYEVHGGDLILVIPGQLHEIRQHKNNKMEYENIMFLPEILVSGKNDVCANEFLNPILNRKYGVQTLFTSTTEGYETVIAPIDNCDNICKTMPLGYELYLKSQLFMFFYLVNSNYRTKSSEVISNKSLERMKHIMKYVELHYPEKLTIEIMAKETGLSEAHFMRYFKDTMNMSFIEYLKDYRLKMAARLLQCSEDPILTVSEEVGFENLSYFNRSFKAKYKVTPSKYRKG